MDKIPEFTKDDYLASSAPFEWLYERRENKFELKQLLSVMSEKARAVGVRNLSTLFKEFMSTMTTTQIVGCNKTDFTGQELELKCGAWDANDFGIIGTDKFGFDITACYHPILPVQRLVNIDTGVHKIKVSYSLGKRWNSVIVDRNVIADTRAIIALSQHGIAVNSENAKHLVRYLSEVEQFNYDSIPEVACVTRLGWIDDYGFSPYVDDLVFDGDEEYRTRFEAIKEKGNRQDWMDCCNSIRSGKTEGNIIARIVLAASFASALAKPCGCLPFFVHLWGGTETGKTVSLLLAASVWADPEIGKYIQTFNGTEVGKELGAAFYNSMPLILDELQLVKDNRKDFDKMIYQLSEGVGRTRGKKSGGLQKTPTWRNCIITTGEHPIISPNSGAGAINRTIEIGCHKVHLFDDPKLTSSLLCSNFGFAGKEFISHLMEDGAIEAAQALQDALQRALKTNDTMDKQTASAALILAADELSERWIFKDGIRLKPEDITPYLVSKETVNQNGRALQFLYDFVNINRAKFSPESDYTGEVWGCTDDEYIYFIKTKLDSILQDEGYNASAFIGWAKENNVIRLGHDGRSSISKRIVGKVARVVCIKAFTGDETFVELEDYLHSEFTEV